MVRAPESCLVSIPAAVLLSCFFCKLVPPCVQKCSAGQALLGAAPVWISCIILLLIGWIVGIACAAGQSIACRPAEVTLRCSTMSASTMSCACSMVHVPPAEDVTLLQL